MEGDTNISKTNQASIIEKSPIANSIQGVIFYNDNLGFFIFKKTERIVEALYIISGFLSDTEPMKFTIKDIAGSLLKETLNLSNRDSNLDHVFNSIFKHFINVSIAINLVRDAGSISNMNANILIEEINKIVDVLLKTWSKTSSQSKTFNPNFFNVGIDAKESDFNNFHYIKSSFTNEDSFRNVESNVKVIKDNVLYNNNQKKVSDHNYPVKDKSNRQEIIVAMLKKDKVLTIRDFSVRIKDCSEKTIQRELITLMAKGVLKKEGERRWSKYSLV